MTSGVDVVVIDASVVVSALIDTSSRGTWAEGVLAHSLAAPHLLDVEVTSSLRRAVATQALSPAAATDALERFDELSIDRFPFRPFGPRVWSLRTSVSSYDAWYVAVAEALEAPLATLDGRLAGSPGPRCRFLMP
jgi:predicted nucleic acid-binding protein